MKLPTDLIPSLPSSTTMAGASSGATASMFAARLGAAWGTASGATSSATSGAAVSNPTLERPGQDSADSGAPWAESARADVPVQAGHLAPAGTEAMPAACTAMTQFWGAAQIPANQRELEATLLATAQAAAVPGDAPEAGLTGTATDPAGVQAAGQAPDSGPQPAAAALVATAVPSGDVPVPGGDAVAPAVSAAPAPDGVLKAGAAGSAAVPAGATGAFAAHATPAPQATVAAPASKTVVDAGRSGAVKGFASQPGSAATTAAAAPVEVMAAAVSAAPVPRTNATAPAPATASATASAPQPGAGSGPQPQAVGSAGTPQRSADGAPVWAGSAAAVPIGAGEPGAAAPEPSRQPVDGAVASPPSTPPAPSPAVLPASVTLPAVPAQLPLLAPPVTQQAVPPGTPMLSEQLARPLFALAAAPLGEHIMTINVIPDALGPVTVRAHLAADGIRIEMMSPSEAGREGLRNILVDLRRDLAAGGLAASLSMGSGNGHQDHGGGHRSPQGSGNPWGSTALAEEQNPASQRRLATSEVPTAANNSLDITV